MGDLSGFRPTAQVGIPTWVICWDSDQHLSQTSEVSSLSGFRPTLKLGFRQTAQVGIPIWVICWDSDQHLSQTSKVSSLLGFRPTLSGDSGKQRKSEFRHG